MNALRHRDGQRRWSRHAYVEWAAGQKIYVHVCALSVQSCFGGGWWHDGWPVSLSEQSESVMMLIRRRFSGPTPPFQITVFFLYPEYQAAVKEDKRCFYIYSLSMLWNYITYWNRAIKEAPPTWRLLFAKARQRPGFSYWWNVEQSQHHHISDRELILGLRKYRCCQKSSITFMNSFLQLPWSDHPSLTKESCDTWSSGDLPRCCGDGSKHVQAGLPL